MSTAWSSVRSLSASLKADVIYFPPGDIIDVSVHATEHTSEISSWDCRVGEGYFSSRFTHSVVRNWSADAM